MTAKYIGRSEDPLAVIKGHAFIHALASKKVGTASSMKRVRTAFIHRMISAA